jgi:hypothetical protein
MMGNNGLTVESGIFVSHNFSLLLKTLLGLLTLPHIHSFMPQTSSISNKHRHELMNVISKGQWRRSKVLMSLDPAELTLSTLQPTIDATSPENWIVSSPILSTLLPTMYTATAGAAKHTEQWSFLWFHGGPMDPYITGHSLVPADLGKLEQIQDFFTPNSLPDASKSLSTVYKNTDTLSTARNSAEFIRINSVMPGAPRPLQDPHTYEYNPKIDKREIETIARHFDLVMKKIPLAVTVFALVDFFGFGGNNLLSTELEENRPKAAVDWVVQSSIRVGIAVIVVWVTVLVSKLTYHPI